MGLCTGKLPVYDGDEENGSVKMVSIGNPIVREPTEKEHLLHAQVIEEIGRLPLLRSPSAL